MKSKGAKTIEQAPYNREAFNAGFHMPIKVRGHVIRWQKPIKVYVLFRTLAIMAVIAGMTSVSARAADQSARPEMVEPSAGVVSCNDFSDKKDTVSSSSKASAALNRRSAGEHSAPALALAIALGLRNASGPIERLHPSPSRME
jgi:hypothetical protein